MSTIRTWTLTKEDMEENFDAIKLSVLEGLIASGLISRESAEEWAENHTIILRKKSFFRTLTDKWKKEEGDDKIPTTLVVVKKV